MPQATIGVPQATKEPDKQRQRLDTLQKEIEELQALGEQATGAKSLKELRGLNIGGEGSEFGRNLDIALGAKGFHGQNVISGTNKGVVGEARGQGLDIIQEAINKRLKEQKGLGTQLLTGVQEEANLKAGVAREQLATQTQQFQSAIDAQLNALLAETGIQAGEAREQVGGTLAARGLGRSTIGSGAIGQVNLAEQQQKAQARGQSAELSTKVERQEQKTLEKLEERRQKIQRARDFSELSFAQDLSFNIDVDALQTKFKEDIAQLQLEANEASFMGDFLGGVLGAGAKIFTGGLL